MNVTFKALVPEEWTHPSDSLQKKSLKTVLKYYHACMTYKLFDSKFCVWIRDIMTNMPCLLGRAANWKLHHMSTNIYYDAGLNELDNKHPRHIVLGFVVFCVWMSVSNSKDESREMVRTIIDMYSEHTTATTLVDGHPTFECDETWSYEFDKFADFYLHYRTDVHHDYRLLRFAGPYIDVELNSYALRWRGKEDGLRPWRRHVGVYNHLMYYECNVDTMYNAAVDDPAIEEMDKSDSEAFYDAVAVKMMEIATSVQLNDRFVPYSRNTYINGLKDDTPTVTE
jgi:hypothetical protein